MRNVLNIAVVNFESKWGDSQANLERIKDYIVSAAKRGADMIVFPELALTGYEVDMEHEGNEQMQCRLAEPVPGPSSQAIAELTKKYDIYVVYGLPQKIDNLIYNAAAIVGPEGVIGSYQKIHLPFSESKWAVRGSMPTMFDTPWGKVSVGICYDTYAFPELTRYYRCMGCRLHINASAVDTIVTAQNVKDAVEYLSANNCIFIATANTINSYENMDGKLIGGSHVIGPSANVPEVHYYAGKPFTADKVDEAELYLGTVDLSYVEKPFLAKQFNLDNPDFRPDLYIIMYQEVLERQEKYRNKVQR